MMRADKFDPGLAVIPLTAPLGFTYGAGVFGPKPELRDLDAIRPSLRDPLCSGPDPVYAIVMDVGRDSHLAELERNMLLVGVVTYAAGRLGQEPVRSQGHVHRVSSHSGWSPPELYEIWSGQACIFMQENAGDDPGRCFAIEAGPGEKVLVPPGWAHAAISTDPRQPMTFGALCDREYGFEYTEVRKRNGLAWYPLLDDQDRIEWQPNPAYRRRPLEQRGPRIAPEFGVEAGVPLYEQVARDFEAFAWISHPGRKAGAWSGFEP